ncbi:MAG: hypothetical protein AAF211_19175 [Myxococcota bacterium]
MNDPFVGWRGELRALRAALDDDGRRLVTLTGLGGIGKTRLLGVWPNHRSVVHFDLGPSTRPSATRSPIRQWGT